MKTIIATTDFTASSLNACNYAAMLANKLNCKLLLFNLYEIPLMHANEGMYFISYQSLKGESDKKMQAFIKKLHASYPKIEVEQFLTTGSFKKEIEGLIKTHHIQAIVMGLASKTKLSRFIYGSHTTDIAGRINAPVIIVPESFKKHTLSNILLAIDNQEKIYKSNLKQLELIANDAKTKFELLSVRTPYELLIQPIPQKLKFNNKEYTTVISKAEDIETGVKRNTKRYKADLIAIISKKHSAFYNLFAESNTKKLAFSSKVPVISLHE
jgi:nucleotide-binding universal stress UspA family protein